MRHVASNLANSCPGVVFLSSFTQIAPLNLATVGMPGCELLLPTSIAEFRSASAGAAEWTLSIPNTPVFAGRHSTSRRSHSKRGSMRSGWLPATASR